MTISAFSVAKKAFPWALAMLMAAAALWSWYHPREVMVPGEDRWYDGTVTLTKTKYVPIPVSTGTGTCTVQGVDEDKDGAADTINGQPVTAIGDAPASKTGYDIATTITPSTGAISIHLKPKEQALFGFESERVIGGRFGYAWDNDGMKTEADVFGQWTFARVGNMHLGAYAEINTQPQAKAMLQVHFQ